MKLSKETKLFLVLAHAVVLLLAVACLIPFLLVISGSITEEQAIYTDGYRLLPRSISVEAYAAFLQAPDRILRAYGITILLTFVGGVLGLFLTAMTAYALQARECRFRNVIAFYFYFTMLFSGGLTPFYILVVRGLQLKDTLWAMLLPLLLSAWYILLMRNFMRTIPAEITDSAKIDGAGHLTIFSRIAAPLSVPALATIGLFIALAYWNDWYYAMLFVDDPRLYPMQYFLYRILNATRFIDAALRGANIASTEMPRESMKMAMAVVATGPIVFLYPVIQRYFVRGLTIGAIKG